MIKRAYYYSTVIATLGRMSLGGDIVKELYKAKKEPSY